MDTSAPQEITDEPLPSSEVDDYSQSTTPIITKNSSDRVEALLITRRLDLNRLQESHDFVNYKITNSRTNIRKYERKFQDLESKINHANDLHKMATNCGQGTQRFVDVLKRESEEVRAKSIRIKNDQEGLEIKLNALQELNANNDKAEEKIRSIEAQIMAIVNLPTPERNANLAQENVELKRKLREKIEEMGTKRKRHQKYQEMKALKMELLREMYDKEIRNMQLQYQVERQREARKEAQNKRQEMQEMINKEEIENANMLKEYEAIAVRNEDMRKNIELKTNLIAEKEHDIKVIVEKAETQKSNAYEKLQQDLKVTDEQLHRALEEKDNYEKTLIQQNEQLDILREKRETLSLLLVEKKSQLTIRQCETAQAALKVEVAETKLRDEINNCEELEGKRDELEKTLEDLRKELEEVPKKFDKTRQQLEREHAEQMTELNDQLKYQLAAKELFRVKRAENAKELEEVEQTIKNMEMTVKIGNDRTERMKISIAELNEKIEKQRAKKVAERQKKQGGRKSPGILKSLSTQLKNQDMTSKRVTFCDHESDDSLDRAILDLQRRSRETRSKRKLFSASPNLPEAKKLQLPKINEKENNRLWYEETDDGKSSAKLDF